MVACTFRSTNVLKKEKNSIFRPESYTCSQQELWARSSHDLHACCWSAVKPVCPEDEDAGSLLGNKITHIGLSQPQKATTSRIDVRVDIMRDINERK